MTSRPASFGAAWWAAGHVGKDQFRADAVVGEETRLNVHIPVNPADAVLFRGSLMAQQRWTREQDLAVLFLRLEYKGRLTQVHPAIEVLAKGMSRTNASIWMRKGNFDSLDLAVPGVGLPNVAKLTRCIWSEFQQDPERIVVEARKAHLHITGQVCS
jgi:hypothetical protein